MKVEFFLSLFQFKPDIAYGQAAEPPWFAAAMQRSLAPLRADIVQVRETVAGLQDVIAGLQVRLAGVEDWLQALEESNVALEARDAQIHHIVAIVEQLFCSLVSH